MRTAVVTIVAGRTEHLQRQVDGLRAADPPPDHHVLVAMDGTTTADLRDPLPATSLVRVPATPRGLPLAAARNAGARAACAEGADLLVFLDVDCIPAPGLIRRYTDAASDPRHAGDLLSGPVHYLPPPPAGGYDVRHLDGLAGPHPARPAPADGAVEVATDPRLFWSLSFAVRKPVWEALGGFCEEYVGYGGEDTDFAESATALGVGLRWVGGATAYHQHHPVSAPPIEHLADILRNGAIFRRRWGWWPMRGWLDAFADRGLVRYDAATDGWQRTGPAAGGTP